MKSIVKLAVVIFAVGFLSNNLFAQEAQDVKDIKAQQTNWVDANGDGICDNVGTGSQGTRGLNRRMNKGANQGVGQGLGNGHGDGTGVRPQDGTGFGRKNGDGTGTGVGRGSGQKGSGRRGGNK